MESCLVKLPGCHFRTNPSPHFGRQQIDKCRSTGEARGGGGGGAVMFCPAPRRALVGRGRSVNAVAETKRPPPPSSLAPPVPAFVSSIRRRTAVGLLCRRVSKRSYIHHTASEPCPFLSTPPHFLLLLICLRCRIRRGGGNGGGTSPPAAYIARRSCCRGQGDPEAEKHERGVRRGAEAAARGKCPASLHVPIAGEWTMLSLHTYFRHAR